MRKVVLAIAMVALGTVVGLIFAVVAIIGMVIAGGLT
jgi:hypothetical protein